MECGMRGMGQERRKQGLESVWGCGEFVWECRDSRECREWSANAGNQGGNASDRCGNAGNRIEIEKIK